ncbi:HalOD1 output domain-containing protein [Halopiger xanaduensis]|uniref:Halobacterial output domain-containing protein n=1 Tax=Halopiger xanaduensis (strain DSM 18323 / JCM 14033 / SH-6) TaxID=797210 RepID=F8D5R6_HALXS|nr:HalOD1 output domain-containing protein [Halopiger xanaduensis]AEH36488.1 hypothetical protein Halxa_1860 [Halopiger xanaduensis SH-6]
MHSVLADHDRALVHRAHFDPAAPDQLVDAIVTAVATVADREPASIPPLAETTDIDALEALIAHARTTGSAIDTTAVVEGLDVRVVSDGRILVYDRTGLDAVAAAASPQPSAQSASASAGEPAHDSGTDAESN